MTDLKKKESKVNIDPVEEIKSFHAPRLGGVIFNEKLAEPCPNSWGTISRHDNEIHSWAFNHLPLSDQQKAELLELLKDDQKIADRKQSLIDERLRRSKLPKIHNPEKLNKERLSVKEKTGKKIWKSASSTMTQNSSRGRLRAKRMS